MWFGNVLLIFGIIGVAFSGIYIQAIMFVKITTKQSHDCYFVFLNNYHIKTYFLKIIQNVFFLQKTVVLDREILKVISETFLKFIKYIMNVDFEFILTVITD